MDRAEINRPPKGWTLNNMPPAGHPDVAEFFGGLFRNAAKYRDDSGAADRWMEGYRLFRGALWGNARTRTSRHQNVVNLLTANIQRTVANITAREPIFEVLSLDGIDDDAHKVLSQWARKWYSDTEQQRSLATTAQNMETYGSTIEKATWNTTTNKPDVVVCDLFSCFPAPGKYDSINDMPYFCHADKWPASEVERVFEISDVSTGDTTKDTLGEDRSDYRAIPANASVDSMADFGTRKTTEETTVEDVLVIEIWAKDYSTKQVQSVDESGNKVIESVPVYPGGLRVVTLVGDIVAGDRYNPNINPELLETGAAQETYLYHNYPFSKADSFPDSDYFWGFATHEQVGDILKRINELMARLDAYCKLSMLPPLILPKDCGISLDKITNKPGLILQPSSTAASQGVRYLQVPNPPSILLQQLENYLQFFDRICQIEDAARGRAPNGVTAAAGIIALQERGEVMIQAKIRAIDYLVRMRGRMAVSMYQNFGIDEELIDIDDSAVAVRGVMLAGRKFQFVVESGSTVARTSVQRMEQAVQLYQLGVIDRQALLENLNFPGWKGIIERVGEGQVDQALQILIQAGMDQNMALELRQYLMQPQQRKPTPQEESQAVPPEVMPAADQAASMQGS